MRKFLTGNEAVARAVFEADVDTVCVSSSMMKTGLFKELKHFKEDLKVDFSFNERISLQTAIQISNTGKSVLTFLDNMDSSIINIDIETDGGLVVILNDDTGIVSEDMIRDNRKEAGLSNLLVMEPGSSRDTKKMLVKAFEISKMYKMPVLFRLTARVGCSSGVVTCEDKIGLKVHPVSLSTEEKLDICKSICDGDDFNKIEYHESKTGVISSGICTFYSKEVLGETVSYLDLKIISPLTDNKMIEFASEMDKIYVIEENNPYIEDYVKSLGIECLGRELFEERGELGAGAIRKGLFGKPLAYVESEDELVESKEPYVDMEYILKLYDI